VAAAIVTEIWDKKDNKFRAMASFNSFDAFYADALKHKRAAEAGILRVHIPGGFALSSEETTKLEALGIERI